MNNDLEDEASIIEALAAKLRESGVDAASWESGGGTNVVVIGRGQSGHGQLWGLAAGTWGGYETDEDGEEVPGSAVVTEIAPRDIALAADFILSRLEAD
jgi:hypothetical protein